MPKRTDIANILTGFAIAIGCLTLPSLTFACESSKPLQISLEGYGPVPFFETLGSMELFKVRRISGSLESRTFKHIDNRTLNQDAPLAKAELTLIQAVSGKVVKGFTTDDRGHFQVTDVPSGSYVLRIVQASKPANAARIEGTLLIELRTDAKDKRLPLIALSMSDCGMEVHKRSKEISRTELNNAQTN